MAKHLIGAIRDILLADASLSSRLPGGVADGQVDRDRELPYLVLESKDMTSLRLFGGSEIQFHRIECSVWATGRAQAESLGNQARDLILPPGDNPTWLPLAIIGWSDINRQPAGGDAIEVDPETRAAGGKDVWCCRRPITWTLSR